jgi:hypothetical protein
MTATVVFCDATEILEFDGSWWPVQVYGEFCATNRTGRGRDEVLEFEMDCSPEIDDTNLSLSSSANGNSSWDIETSPLPISRSIRVRQLMT